MEGRFAAGKGRGLDGGLGQSRGIQRANISGEEFKGPLREDEASEGRTSHQGFERRERVGRVLSAQQASVLFFKWFCHSDSGELGMARHSQEEEKVVPWAASWIKADKMGVAALERSSTGQELLREGRFQATFNIPRHLTLILWQRGEKALYNPTDQWLPEYTIQEHPGVKKGKQGHHGQRILREAYTL
ncbi:hypothetical protein NDU88_004874 [Pleurodeles waltl]|uniref:Uncharacterized protein n=1 Tax=Pleurodeles waltl TaxID=8319 RepID=A0AAV7MF94_PLEWA|nr:hypothetical protein NDU88_004874 [Pleurodeles waltl]